MRNKGLPERPHVAPAATAAGATLDSEQSMMDLIPKSNQTTYFAMQNIMNLCIAKFYSWPIVGLCSRLIAPAAQEQARKGGTLRRVEQGSSFCGAFCYGWCYRQHGVFSPVAPVAFSLPARTQARPSDGDGSMLHPSSG